MIIVREIELAFNLSLESNSFLEAIKKAGAKKGKLWRIVFKILSYY
jgi:hypothetical protein